MAEIFTRFGALDRRLAVAVRHAIERAVFLPALAPLNDVYEQLASHDGTVPAGDLPSEPPSHRWHELMADLFGQTVAGIGRSPVGERGGLPNEATAEQAAYAASHPLTAAQRRVVHHLLAAAGAFVVAESMILDDALERRRAIAPDDVFDDLPTRSLLDAGQAGLALSRAAESGTWHELLSPRASVPVRVTVVQQPAVAPAPVHPRRFRRGHVAALMAVLGLVAAAGVFDFHSGAGGDEPPSATQPLTRAHDEKLETPELRVAIMPTTDVGPFNLAVRNGDFADAGFTFDPGRDVTVVDSGQEAIDLLTAGKVDIAYSTYTPMFLAKHQGADVKLVAGASSAGAGSCMVVAMPGGKVRRLQDMRGARVAVTARNTMSDLLIKAALRDKGIDSRSVRWVETRFPDMADKLRRGEVDAAFMIEPFLSDAKKTIGARAVFDTATGPRVDLPTAGFAARGDFVRENPRTVAAFQRVMAGATVEAPGRPADIQLVLRPLLLIDMETVRSSSLLTFRSDLDVHGLRKVTGLMHRFGLIHGDVDVASMIVRYPR